MLGTCPEFLKPGLLLSDFKADADLISFLQWQRVEIKIVKVKQTMLFGQKKVSKLPVIINGKMS